MIVRARTEIDKEYILRALNGKENKPFMTSKSVFFVDSGSTALRLFLRVLGKGKRVGIQVFTCKTVLDVVVEEGCIPYFFDIDKEYYTTTFSMVRDNIENIDVLILSHLFGIPNPDYNDIKELCLSKSVILIDDLCQTFHAKVGDSFLEELSDNYFYSFFYDKPVSMISGGMLKVSLKYVDSVMSIYNKLPKESENRGKKELKILLHMHEILSPNIYNTEFRSGYLWKCFLGIWPIRWNEKYAYKILKSYYFRSFNWLMRYFEGNKIKISKMSRMSEIRKSYIAHMMGKYKDNNGILCSFIKHNHIYMPQYLSDDSIKCSIAKRAIIGSKFISSKAEFFLYNWPRLICDDAHYCLYPNAESVVKDCINIPVWTEDICYVENDMFNTLCD